MKRSTEKQALRRSADRWYTQVSKVLRGHGIRYFQGSYHNRVRLLTWKVWHLRYGVSLEWIVSHLLEIYAKARHGNPESLGLTIPMLTGEKAHSWLLTHIQREFPSQENLAVRRSELQAKLAAIPNKIRVNGELSVEQYIEEYRRATQLIRNGIPAEAARFPRPWRGNPWK